MLLTVDALEHDSNRLAVYQAQQFIIREIGEQGLADLELASPLDSEIDVLDTLKAYHDALGDFYADGSINDSRARRGDCPELDGLMGRLAAAIEDEEDYLRKLEQDDEYYHRLNESYARFSEAWPR